MILSTCHVMYASASYSHAMFHVRRYAWWVLCSFLQVSRALAHHRHKNARADCKPSAVSMKSGFAHVLP